MIAKKFQLNTFKTQKVITELLIKNFWKQQNTGFFTSHYSELELSDEVFLRFMQGVSKMSLQNFKGDTEHHKD